MIWYIGRLDPSHELSFIRMFKRGLLGGTYVNKPRIQSWRWTYLDQIPRFVEFASMVMHWFGRWLTASSQKLGEVVHRQSRSIKY